MNKLPLTRRSLLAATSFLASREPAFFWPLVGVAAVTIGMAAMHWPAASHR